MQQTIEIGDALTMLDMRRDAIMLRAPKLHLVTKAEQIHAATLSFQLDPATYEQVDQRGDFNLGVEVRENLDGPPFNNDTPISIEASLHPQYLDYFAPYRLNLAGAASFLATLAEMEPAHPLIHTESWLATEVSQSGPRGTSRYRTLWQRLKIAANTFEKFERGDFNPELQAFLRSKIGMDLALLPEQFSAEALDQLTSGLGELIGGGLSNLFEVLPDAVEAEDEENMVHPLEGVAAFLDADGWSWEASPDSAVILTGANGDNGQFACQIVWEGAHEYLVCYAILPVAVHPQRITAITEFLNRANYGLPSGNFEMEPESGEIRFRNSRFVGDTILTYDEIEDLLYTAVFQADIYTPGFQRVNDGLSPKDAIAVVEDQ
jgi:hypothetical protein